MLNQGRGLEEYQIHEIAFITLGGLRKKDKENLAWALMTTPDIITYDNGLANVFCTVWYTFLAGAVSL